MKSTLDVWPSREAALAAIFDACARSPACAAAPPRSSAHARRDSRPAGAAKAAMSMLTDPRTGEPQTMRMTFDQVIGALQPFTYAPELAALLPEVIGRAAAGDFGPLYSGAMLVTGDLDEQSNTALHYSVTCAEDVPRVSADGSGRARSRPCARRRWPNARSRSARCGRRASRRPTRRRRSKATCPVLILSGGLDPGHAPREWRRGREVAAGKPPHHRPRLRPHRVPACVRAAAHRRLHRRPDVRDAARVLRRAFREEPAAAALARPARGPLLDRRRKPRQGVRPPSAKCTPSTALRSPRPIARSPDCSDRTAPARRRSCECSRR